MFRLKETPSTAEALCAIAGTAAGGVVDLKGMAKMWSYVWSLCRFSDADWKNEIVSNYLGRKGEDRDEADERLF